MDCAQLLKQAGLKQTPRRQAMLRVLSCGQPMTAESVADALDGSVPADLSTVYRALNQMAEHRLLQKTVYQDGKVYYKLVLEQHTHRLVCTCCHRSIPVELCPVEQMARSLEESTGFQITGHRLEFTGLCPDCAAEHKKDKSNQ